MSQEDPNSRSKAKRPLVFPTSIKKVQGIPKKIEEMESLNGISKTSSRLF